MSGEIIANDLDQMLIKEGYSIKRIITYKVIPVNEFKDEFVKKIKIKMPEIVYIYSQNSAISFLNLIKKYQLDSSWIDTNLMCIGEKTSLILN